jgi:hypothetical protein
VFDIGKSEREVLNRVLTTSAGDLFIENRETRATNTVQWFWRTKTDLTTNTENLPAPFVGGVWVNVHDAGKNPAFYLGLQNGITAGVIIDPATTTIRPDARPILYLKPEGRFYVPLAHFGFDPDVIVAVECRYLTAGTVKVVFHLGPKYGGRVVDAMKEDLVDVRDSAGNINWGSVTPKPINPPKKVELGLLSSVADAVDALLNSHPLAQLKCVAKSVGDVLITASGLRTGAYLGFVNELYGIPPVGAGIPPVGAGGWYAFEDTPMRTRLPAPVGMTQSSLDLSKNIDTIANGIECIVQDMPSQGNPDGGFTYVPGQPTPDQLSAGYIQMITKSLEEVRRRFDDLGTSIAEDRPWIFEPGGTERAGVGDAKAALTEALNHVRSKVEAYYTALDGLRATSDLPTLRKLAEHATHALECLTPRFALRKANGTLQRQLLIVTNPTTFRPWEGIARPLPEKTFYGFSSLIDAIGNERVRSALRAKIPPPPAAPASAAAAAAAASAAPASAMEEAGSGAAAAAAMEEEAGSGAADEARRRQLLLRILECDPTIVRDTALWWRLTSLPATEPGTFDHLNKEIEKRCPKAVDDGAEDEDEDGDEDEGGTGEGKEGDEDGDGTMEGKESGKKRGRDTSEDGGPRGKYTKYTNNAALHELGLFCSYVLRVAPDRMDAVLAAIPTLKPNETDTELISQIQAQYRRVQAQEEMEADERTRAKSARASAAAAAAEAPEAAAAASSWEGALGLSPRTASESDSEGAASSSAAAAAAPSPEFVTHLARAFTAHVNALHSMRHGFQSRDVVLVEASELTVALFIDEAEELARAELAPPPDVTRTTSAPASSTAAAAAAAAAASSAPNRSASAPAARLSVDTTPPPKKGKTEDDTPLSFAQQQQVATLSRSASLAEDSPPPTPVRTRGELKRLIEQNPDIASQLNAILRGQQIGGLVLGRKPRWL